MYLDSTSIFDTSINTLANLNIIMTSCMISQYKITISKEHAKIVNLAFAKYMKNVIVLNINDYHSIHIK